MPSSEYTENKYFTIAVRIIGVLFEVLVDMNTVANCPIQQSKVENLATEAVDHLLPFSVVHSFISWLSGHISTSVPFFLIWLSLFVMNVMYVMEKLFLVSCLAYCLWCCIASIVDYCRVFIQSVLYIVILYAVHSVFSRNVV